MTPQFNKVAIIGVGLLGGSLGLNILDKNRAATVVGFGRNKSNLLFAKKKGQITHISHSITEAVDQADLIILAAPVQAILDYLPLVARTAKAGSIVMDVGSTKDQIVAMAKKIFKNKVYFVGAHPMAGTEKSGAQAAFLNLYQDTKTLLCFLPQTPMSVKKVVKEFWSDLGCQTLLIEAKTHDAILSLTSHLPQIASYVLLSSISDFLDPRDIKKMSGGGFKDTTRLAASNALMWADICMSNRAHIIKALTRLRFKIDLIINLLNKKKRRDLWRFFDDVSRFKSKLNKMT